VPAKLVQQLGTGRRKDATARVFLRPGKGQITVNKRPFENYFVSESARAYVRQPLLAGELADRFDIVILARGGGVTGQAGAARLGIARASIEVKSEQRGTLKQLG
jgi:small subunit ribosomal protein S9